MKKAFLLVCILSLSVITTACINNFAVQELNSKAMTFIEEGNYPEAIERLKSSIDLDGSVFESHYNLAVAYTKAEEYSKAIEAYQDAISLKPEFADSYYSLAVAEESLATEINNGTFILDTDGNPVKRDINDDEFDEFERPVLTETEDTYVKNLYNDAIKNYNLYLSKAKNIDDIDDVKERIASLEGKVSSEEAQKTVKQEDY